MIVYNVSKSEVTYKGRKIPANGGSVLIPDLTFIPTRDLELEAAKILSFGKLPQWWLSEVALKATLDAAAEAAAAPAPAPVPAVIKNVVITTDDSAEKFQSFGSKKK